VTLYLTFTYHWTLINDLTFANSR